MDNPYPLMINGWYLSRFVDCIVRHDYTVGYATENKCENIKFEKKVHIFLFQGLEVADLSYQI